MTHTHTHHTPDQSSSCYLHTSTKVTVTNNNQLSKQFQTTNSLLLQRAMVPALENRVVIEFQQHV